MDYDLHAAFSADRLLDPGRDPITLTSPQPRAVREHLAGHALNEIGWHAKLGHHQDALTASQAALTRYQELGDRHGESAAWDSVGYAQYHLGHHVEAIASYQHALDLNRALGHRYFQALNLAHLGDTYGTTGDHHSTRTPTKCAPRSASSTRHSTSAPQPPCPAAWSTTATVAAPPRVYLMDLGRWVL